MNNYNIFGTLKFDNDEEFEKLISSITHEQAIFFIKEGIKYAYTQGVFTLNESEIISKSIRKLYLPKNDVNEN
jgi:hypothetical protein